MNTTHNISQYRVSTSALSIALLICSGLWFTCACAYYATNAFKRDWSATPLCLMLLLMMTPVICFGLGMILVDTRKHSRFSRLVWGALLAAVLPVSLGTVLTVWAVMGLFATNGAGI